MTYDENGHMIQVTNRKFKIKVKDEDHSKKVQEYLFSLGYEWPSEQKVKYTDQSCLFFEDIADGLIITYGDKQTFHIYTDYQEVELIEHAIKHVTYEFKVVEREVIQIGDKSYYKDELETALKNINPI